MISAIVRRLSKRSIEAGLAEGGFFDSMKRLKRIVPDISNQESRNREPFDDYWELKRRGLHAFQCSLMIKALEGLPHGRLTIVDIGDSAGTHMLYLKGLTKDRFNIDTVSVNLDPIAVEKIKARGLEAVLCRAEDLELGDKTVDLFTSFEMVEHLHNPSIFFRRLAKKARGNKMLITVPYLKRSRVGFHNLRKRWNGNIYAEDEHIFELSPEDWNLLMLHSGWKVVYSKVYYQYPRRIPLVSQILGAYWRKTDFEGFWGAILEKDDTYSNLYQDWED